MARFWTDTILEILPDKEASSSERQDEEFGDVDRILVLRNAVNVTEFLEAVFGVDA